MPLRLQVENDTAVFATGLSPDRAAPAGAGAGRGGGINREAAAIAGLWFAYVTVAAMYSAVHLEPRYIAYIAPIPPLLGLYFWRAPRHWRRDTATYRSDPRTVSAAGLGLRLRIGRDVAAARH